MAQMLVEYGHSNLNAVNDIGNTPLHYALMYGADTSLGPWLIKKGADDKVIFPLSYFIFVNSFCSLFGACFVFSKPS